MISNEYIITGICFFSVGLIAIVWRISRDWVSLVKENDRLKEYIAQQDRERNSIGSKQDLLDRIKYLEEWIFDLENHIAQSEEQISSEDDATGSEDPGKTAFLSDVHARDGGHGRHSR